jgi:hypothetical protein
LRAPGTWASGTGRAVVPSGGASLGHPSALPLHDTTHGACTGGRSKRGHIPPDEVVNGGAAAEESDSPRDDQFRSHGWTRFRRQHSEKITSVTSMVWHFTTESGGV